MRLGKRLPASLSPAKWKRQSYPGTISRTRIAAPKRRSPFHRLFSISLSPERGSWGNLRQFHDHQPSMAQEEHKMANNYLEFSEVIPHLTAEEEAWLRSQLQCVYVFGSQEFTEDELPSGLHGEDADWYGCRAWRGLPGYDPRDGGVVGCGCGAVFATGGGVTWETASAFLQAKCLVSGNNTGPASTRPENAVQSYDL